MAACVKEIRRSSDQFLKRHSADLQALRKLRAQLLFLSVSQLCSTLVAQIISSRTNRRSKRPMANTSLCETLVSARGLDGHHEVEDQEKK